MSSDFDVMVEGLMAYGVSREKAIARARTSYPEAAEAQDAASVKRADVLEKREQWAITRMARAIGFTVRSTSQPRASKVAPGIPDLILTYSTTAAVHGTTRGFFGFWETKRSRGGKRSTSQIEFGDDCIRADIPYGFGDRHHFAQWLRQHGFTPPPTPLD
jgi:hypothetical protein